MHPSRLYPPAAARALSRTFARLKGVFSDTPILFFAVVVGVALTFRVAVGWARSTPPAEVQAPHFTTTPRADAPNAEEGATPPAAAPRDSAPLARPTAAPLPSSATKAAPTKPTKKRKAPLHQ